ELKVREQKLTDFVKAKHAELVTGARQRVAEYMLAAHALRDQPSTDDFMLIAETNDLNPTMIGRWQKYLERSRNFHDPVFAPWHALAAVSEKSWEPDARMALSKLAANRERPVNALTMHALTDNLPKSLSEAAKRYAEVLHAVEKK